MLYTFEKERRTRKSQRRGFKGGGCNWRWILEVCRLCRKVEQTDSLVSTQFIKCHRGNLQSILTIFDFVSQMFWCHSSLSFYFETLPLLCGSSPRFPFICLTDLCKISALTSPLSSRMHKHPHHASIREGSNNTWTLFSSSNQTFQKFYLTRLTTSLPLCLRCRDPWCSGKKKNGDSSTLHAVLNKPLPHM